MALNVHYIQIRINKKSNLIEETISKEEAIRRGILEVTGEIASHLDTQNSDWDIITKDMKKYKGAVILSGENLDLISAETEKQKVLEIEITRLTRLRAEQMAKTANDEVRAVTINRGSGNMSIGYDKLTILEQVSMEMSMKSEDPRQREYIDSLQSTGPQSNILFDVAYDNRQSR